MDITSILEEAMARTGLPEVATRSNTFIQLAESQLNKELQGALKTLTTIAITTDINGNYTLPADFNSIQSLYNEKGVIMDHSHESLIKSTVKYMHGYYIENGIIKTNLINTNFSLTYYKNIPSLNGIATNWLSEYDPEIYIYAIMFQALTFASMQASAPEQLGLLSSKTQAAKMYLDSLIDQFKQNDHINRYAGAKISIRAAQ
jgi:flagellin-like hook-associated protein FlgL